MTNEVEKVNSDDHVVIIGNGISGVTTARNLRKKSDCKITIISAETKYFFSRTALMYVYMGHMEFEHTQPYEPHFWGKNKIDLLEDRVVEVDFQSKVLKLEKTNELAYDRLVLAVGSKPNKFGWPGQDLPGVQGLYSYQDLQLLEENTHPPFTPSSQQKVKTAVIVGGGLIGVELAEMLITRNVKVIFLVRESKFWGNVLPEEEGNLVIREIRKHHVDLRLESELSEIHAGEDGRVNSITTKSGEKIECELVGLTAGVSPNISFLQESALETNRGIVVNRYLETNQKHVYAVGDCAEFTESYGGRRPIEQVWYTGRMMGETLAETLAGNRIEYTPGHWFNSAKFFDIEYQTYGWVLARLNEGEKAFYWEHHKGEKCLKVVFEEKTGKFLGMNVFGIRIRHNVMDGMLEKGALVEEVISNLRNLNFDPEFYTDHAAEIVEQFNRESGRTASLKKKSWKEIFRLRTRQSANA